MDAVGFEIHRSIFRLLIASYVRAGLLETATETFYRMIHSGCRDFGIDYNQFIGVLIQHSQLELAKKIYLQMAFH